MIERPTAGRLFRVGITLGLILLVVPFVVYAVPALVGADVSFVVLSGSMEPKISTGDAVVVEEVDPTAIQRGDVITYQLDTDTPPTTHQVIEVVEEDGQPAFRTRGIANEDPDPRVVPADRVVGRVMLVIPYMGYVVEFVRTPIGFGLLLIGPIGLLLATELLSFVHSARSDGASRDGAEFTERSPSQPTRAGKATATAESSRGQSRAMTDEATGRTSGSAGGETAGETYTLTRTDLRLTVGVLGVVAPYSGWIAYSLREPWAISGAVMAGAGLLLCAGLYIAAGPDSGDEGEPSEQSGEAGTPVQRVSRLRGRRRRLDGRGPPVRRRDRTTREAAAGARVWPENGADRRNPVRGRKRVGRQPDGSTDPEEEPR